MNALLVMDNKKVQGFRIMVSLTEKKLKEKVISLLEQDRVREAFDILKSSAKVKEYLPKGRKPKIQPQVTLFEDML